MKGIDKLVLIPIEKYERLLKSINPKELIDTTSQLNSENETGEKETNKEANKRIEEGEEEDKQTDSKTSVTISNKEKEGGEEEEKKVPPPPPGIPNKRKEGDFTWMKLSLKKKNKKEIWRRKKKNT